MPVAIIPLFRAATAAKGVALVTLSRYHPTNRTPSVSLCSTAPPLGSRVSLAAPAGGSAVTAAKGVALVALSRYHSTNHTPSVRPFGLPAPPLGSRVSLAAPAGGGAPRPSRCPRWGKCRDSGKGGGVGNIEPLPSNEPHPLSLALLDSSPIGEPSSFTVLEKAVTEGTVTAFGFKRGCICLSRASWWRRRRRRRRRRRTGAGRSGPGAGRCRRSWAPCPGRR